MIGLKIVGTFILVETVDVVGNILTSDLNVLWEASSQISSK